MGEICKVTNLFATNYDKLSNYDSVGGLTFNKYQKHRKHTKETTNLLDRPYTIC